MSSPASGQRREEALLAVPKWPSPRFVRGGMQTLGVGDQHLNCAENHAVRIASRVGEHLGLAIRRAQTIDPPGIGADEQVPIRCEGQHTRRLQRLGEQLQSKAGWNLDRVRFATDLQVDGHALKNRSGSGDVARSKSNGEGKEEP